MIRKYHPKDLQSIVDILNYYVKNDACIFQVESYTFDEIEKKFEIIQATYPIFIEEKDNKVIGFAYGARWRDNPLTPSRLRPLSMYTLIIYKLVLASLCIEN